MGQDRRGEEEAEHEEAHKDQDGGQEKVDTLFRVVEKSRGQITRESGEGSVPSPGLLPSPCFSAHLVIPVISIKLFEATLLLVRVKVFFSISLLGP